MKPQPERSPHARAGAFHRPDELGKGTEREVSLLLAAHVRLLKPKLVIETGTYHGDTTLPMWEALVDNASDGFPGALRAYEVDPTAFRVTGDRLAAAGRVDGASYELIHDTLQTDPRVDPVDVAFVDSAFAARDADVRALALRMSPRGIIFVHDADMPQMTDVVGAWRASWNVILYPTPRGLAALQHQ